MLVDSCTVFMGYFSKIVSFVSSKVGSNPCETHAFDPFFPARRGWAVKENDKELRLRLDMSGLSKEDVKISVEQNTLVICGEADHDNDGKGRRHSSRIDLIPSHYNVNEIKAEMRNGVLKVAIPKVGDEEKKDAFHVQVE